MIDPASNLEGTRERMRIWVEAAFSQWEGVVGKEPDAVHALKQVRTKVRLVPGAYIVKHFPPSPRGVGIKLKEKSKV